MKQLKQKSSPYPNTKLSSSSKQQKMKLLLYFLAAVFSSLDFATGLKAVKSAENSETGFIEDPLFGSDRPKVFIDYRNPAGVRKGRPKTKAGLK